MPQDGRQVYQVRLAGAIAGMGSGNSVTLLLTTRPIQRT